MLKGAKPRGGFTLVELLTVIGIMALLSGILVASFSQLGAVSVSAAGNSVQEAATLARQNSISKDAYTALVVLTTGSNAYSTYCIIDSPRDPTSGNFSTTDWEIVSPWHQLPKGVVFDTGTIQMPSGDSSFTGSNFFTLSSSTLIDPSVTITYQGTPIKIGSGQAAFEIFAPDGTLYSNSQAACLQIVRGTWNGSSITYQPAGTPKDFYNIIFLPDTGQTKVVRP